jgi:hypothetical protein
MEKHVIKYNGREIEITEPTIEIWKKLTSMKTVLETDTFGIHLVSAVTEIPVEELRDMDTFEVLSVAEALSEYYLKLDTKFYDEFEFEGVTYKFTNLKNMKFGQYIDIQTFYADDEATRTKNLNKLMAMLYLPKGCEYEPAAMNVRAEDFNRLPVRYLQGAALFFSILITSLNESTQPSSVVKMMRWKVMGTILRTIGGGITSLLQWVNVTLSKWKRYLNYR